jgi:hypothetical protein
MENFAIPFFLGVALGGSVFGYASYWLATHIGQLRADVARVQGHVEGQGGAVSAAIAKLATPGLLELRTPQPAARAPAVPVVSKVSGPVIGPGEPSDLPALFRVGTIAVTHEQLAALNEAAAKIAPKPAS